MVQYSWNKLWSLPNLKTEEVHGNGQVYDAGLLNISLSLSALSVHSWNLIFVVQFYIMNNWVFLLSASAANGVICKIFFYKYMLYVKILKSHITLNHVPCYSFI